MKTIARHWLEANKFIVTQERIDDLAALLSATAAEEIAKREELFADFCDVADALRSTRAELEATQKQMAR